MFTFGQKPTFQSSADIDFGVSEDKRSFTLEFGTTGFQLDTGASKAPLATRAFYLVVPLEGDGKAEIAFAAQTSVVALNGATATIVLSVNGQTAVTDIPGQDQEQSLNTELRFVAENPAECRLSLVFLGGRDSTNADSQAVLTGLSVDAELLPRPPQPTGPTRS